MFAFHDGRLMKIGELARATQTDVQTIRFYEREHLLRPLARTAGNYRIYDESDAHRLAFIRRCRSLDISLDEIRMLLRFIDGPAEGCEPVTHLLDEHLQQVDRRTRELKKLRGQLQALRDSCDGRRAASECGILRELSAPAPRRVEPKRKPG